MEIDVPSLGQKAVFPCGRWLDKDKDDGLLERELVPVEETQQQYKPRESVNLATIILINNNDNDNYKSNNRFKNNKLIHLRQNF